MPDRVFAIWYRDYDYHEELCALFYDEKNADKYVEIESEGVGYLEGGTSEFGYFKRTYNIEDAERGFFL